MTRTATLATLCALALALAAAGCGGSPTRSEGGGTSGDGSGSSSGADGGGEIPAGAPAGMAELGGVLFAEGLIPELSAVPMPEGGGYLQGTAYTELQDPLQRAIQTIYFDQSVDEVAAFFEDELPGAGFTIEGTDSSGDGQFAEVRFTDPDGRSGKLLIDANQVGPPTKVYLELIRKP